MTKSGKKIGQGLSSSRAQPDWQPKSPPGPFRKRDEKGSFVVPAAADSNKNANAARKSR